MEILNDYAFKALVPEMLVINFPSLTFFNARICVSKFSAHCTAVVKYVEILVLVSQYYLFVSVNHKYSIHFTL